VKLRSAEWLLTAYFAYVALISPAFPLSTRFSPWVVAILVPALLLVLARAQHPALRILRDWIPIALLLVAYREMDWFSALPRNFGLELRWVQWDRALLHPWRLQSAIETLGPIVPLYLEACYLLVYGVGSFLIAACYFEHRRERVNGVLFLYLLGTLLAYALLPYFPSDPPRVAFGGSDAPNVSSALRELNLWIVADYGIHSSVFPSAHVSSAFSAAWALFACLPERRRIGWGMLIYAVSVGIATIYGRYHYAADVVAGMAVSLVPAAMILLARPLRLRGLLALP
jgi:membrane-associated phospholipid phosphatase